MAVITATSDFGWKDAAVAELKAQCYGKLDQFHWVDISHEVEPYNIWQGAFLLRRIYKDFKPGTIHMLLVGAAPRKELDYLVMKADGQYFMAPNNGMLAYVLRDAKINAARVLQIANVASDDYMALFAGAAAHLSEGGKIDFLGPSVKSIVKLKESAPAISDFSIQGQIIYVDHLGTCITNITKPLFDSHKNGRKHAVELPRSRSITKTYDRLGDIPQASIASYWDRHGHLCIVVGKSGGDRLKGSNELLGYNVNDWVRIDFYGQ